MSEKRERELRKSGLKPKPSYPTSLRFGDSFVRSDGATVTRRPSKWMKPLRSRCKEHSSHGYDNE